MKKGTLQSLIAIVVILGIGFGMAWAGSQGSVRVLELPLFALCAAFAFVVNWLVFVPAYVFQTERYFDLTGSLTYLCLVATVLWLGGNREPRTFLIAAAVAIWAIRLGSFLFRRILEDGSDGRFDRIKPDLARLLMTWTLQGLWVFLTFACGLAAMSSSDRAPLGWSAALGSGLWVIGFSIESFSDHQKRVFRRDPANEGRFITTGLWAWSRHPNYFGEITLWVGVALISLPVLSGWQMATLVSPFFVFVLLTRISGIPLLEARGQKRWGNEPAYADYKARTPALFPRLPGTRPLDH